MQRSPYLVPAHKVHAHPICTTTYQLSRGLEQQIRTLLWTRLGVEMNRQEQNAVEHHQHGLTEEQAHCPRSRLTRL